MKKIFAILLLLAMCLGVLAACTQNPNVPAGTETGAQTSDGAAATLEEAVEYLTSTYKSDEGKATPADYKLIAQIPIGDVTFTISWTCDNDAIVITLADGLYNVDVPAKNDTEVTYTLTATVSDGTSTVEKNFTRTLPVYDNSAAVGADDIKENTPYKLYLVQVGAGKTLFATTETQSDNKYIKTDIDPKKGADFFAEKVDGGYKFYTEIAGVKNYVHAKTTTAEDGKVSKYIGYATESECVYYFKADCNAWFVKIDNIEYVVGTYSSYETICISEGTYMTPDTTGVTQFPVLLMEKDKAEALDPTVPEIPADEEKSITDFNAIASAQPDKGAATLGKYIVTGKVTEIKNTQYGNMNIADDAGNSLYIYGMYDKTGEIRFDAMNPQPKVGDTVVVVGVACNYGGPQMKNAWLLKLNGEDYVSSGSGSTDTPVVPDVPTVDDVKENTEYKFFLAQLTAGKVLYATAEMDQGKFIKGTTDAKAALDFFAEKVEGGYKFYTTIDGAKQYLHARVEPYDDGSGKMHKYIGYAAESDNIWYYKADVNGWFVTLNGAEYVLGTYNTYETFSMSEAKHLTAENTGKTQFPGNLILKTDAEGENAPVIPETPDTPATPDEPSAGDKTITEFNTIASAQPDKGDTTTNKYTVTGEITEIKSTQYGNMYIKDAEGNQLYIYGVYSADGKVRFDAMNPQPKVGDTIVITGVACNYNGPQMKNGWLLKLNGEDYVAEAPAEPEIPDGVAASISFSDVANRTEFSTEKQVWVQNGITVTNNKGASTSNVADYSDPARFYKSSELTIAYTGMTKIVINTAGDRNLSTDFSVSAGTLTVDGAVATITFDAPVDSVTFAELSAQIRVAQILIYK